MSVSFGMFAFLSHLISCNLKCPLLNQTHSVCLCSHCLSSAICNAFASNICEYSVIMATYLCQFHRTKSTICPLSFHFKQRTACTVIGTIAKSTNNIVIRAQIRFDSTDNSCSKYFTEHERNTHAIKLLHQKTSVSNNLDKF